MKKFKFNKPKVSFDLTVKNVSLGVLTAFSYVGFNNLVFSRTNDFIVYIVAVIVIASLVNNILDK